MLHLQGIWPYQSPVSYIVFKKRAWGSRKVQRDCPLREKSVDPQRKPFPKLVAAYTQTFASTGQDVLLKKCSPTKSDISLPTESRPSIKSEKEVVPNWSPIITKASLRSSDKHIVPSISCAVDNKNTVKVMFNHVETEALLDSGCNGVSLVDSNTVSQFKDNFSSCSRKLRLADGSKELSVVGCLTANIKLGKVSREHEFIIVDQLCVPIIFGTDLLNVFGITLDFAKGAVLSNGVFVCDISDNFNKQNLCSSVAVLNEVDKFVSFPKDESFVVGVNQDEWQNCVFTEASEGIRFVAESGTVKELTTHCDVSSVSKVRNVLKKYDAIISKGDFDLGKSTAVEHTIDVEPGPPIRQPLRSMNHNQLESVRKNVDDMVSHGIVVPSRSAWSSPLVLVKKKDGSDRMCVDYRLLNGRTFKDAYPIPRIDDILDHLGRASWFTTLDLKSGYWQIGIEQESRDKTAFSTPFGLFEFTVMPFGLCNAPATFQRIMNEILGPLLYRGVIVYLDDIIIYSDTQNGMFSILDLVFDKFRAANIKINLKKCNFCCEQVKFLGHVVTKNGVCTDPEKVRKVAEWPIPTNVKELQSFLGLANYYRRFVKGYSQIAHPLTQLTSSKKLNWNEKADESFKKLKTALCNAPILAYPLFDENAGKFCLDVDASGNAVGAVLSQLQDGVERVVAYGSRALSSSQKNYGATQRELLAIFIFLEVYRHYLLPSKFLIRTDHQPLTWLKNSKSSSLLRRWELRIGEFDIEFEQRLSEFNYDISHRAGRSHANADAMSRIPENSVPTANDHSVLAVNSSISDDFRSHQNSDPEIAYLINCLSTNVAPDEEKIRGWSKYGQQIFAVWDELVVKDMMLIRENFERDKLYNRIVIPYKMAGTLAHDIHRSVAGGHMGMAATKQKIRDRYWWPGLTRTVEEVVRRCNVCQKSKPIGRPTKGPLFPINNGYPMQTVHLDIAGPLTVGENGEKYIILLVDAFSNWVEAKAVSTVDIETVAQTILDEWIFRFGAPERLVSDQGGNVSGDLIKQLCRLLNIQKIRTTPYHPEGNGKAERTIGTVKRLLRSMIGELGRNWPNLLQGVLFAIRSAECRTTGYTPHCLLFGREICFPSEKRFEKFQQYNTPADYVYNLIDRINWIERKAREQFRRSKRYCRSTYNRSTKPYNIKVGDEVFRINKGLGSKSTPRIGPYTVIELRGNGVFRIKSHDEDANQPILSVNGRDIVKVYQGKPVRTIDFDRVSEESSNNDDQLQSDDNSSNATEPMHDCDVVNTSEK